MVKKKSVKKGSGRKKVSSKKNFKRDIPKDIPTLNIKQKKTLQWILQQRFIENLIR